MRGTEPPRASGAMALVVRLPDGRILRFRESFYLGREQGCEVQVDDAHASRRHAEVARLRGEWIIRDLQSSNGLFVNGERVDLAPIGEGVTVTLSADGPMLHIGPESEPAPPPTGGAESEDSAVINAYARRYLESESDESAGGRTLMIRKAFQKVRQQQRRRHRLTVGVLTLAVLCAAGYALYQNRVISRQEAAAERLFYSMKDQEVRFAAQEQKLAQAGIEPGQEEVARYMAQRRQMERDYEGYVEGLYDKRLNEKERLILRVTRIFGECDVAAPPDYIREVTHYIGKWQSTRRFAAAVKRARDFGYTEPIARTFMAHGLPPQYFYLAMQESDFIAHRSGPPTRWGFAKGMWQFIPETGKRFGLKIGPLASVPQPDPEDERFQWEKATAAAARYVKDIYATDAQASGLLVIASYNWGEHRIIDRVRKMPADPRERNFWKLLAQHKVPGQTYDYVFSIVAAAVIGENPRLFGFPLDSPLKFVDQH
jgi:membrane-bound lytic murein transglycosylase D